MADFIGNIQVPKITPSGTFPLVPDPGFGRVHTPKVATHYFRSGNAKISQRFLLGTGAKQFTFSRHSLKEADRITLRNFWESNSGAFGAFTYNAPNEDSNGTTPFTVRFADPALAWSYIDNVMSSISLGFVEIPSESSAPTYPLNATVQRFPSGTLATALTAQEQVIIPLVKITPKHINYPSIFMSDRRATIGSQLYLPRMLSFDGIQQSLAESADQATFSLGNADRIMTRLVNDTDLWRARLEFSLYHVGTGIKIDLWAGEVVDWNMDEGPTFQLKASDGVYELTLPYPVHTIVRDCWKDYNDALACPWATASGTVVSSRSVRLSDNSTLSLNFTPTTASCDKGFRTANGCLAHKMEDYYGGVIAVPQGVRTRDNSNDGALLVSYSLIADTVYDRPLQEVYTDSDFPVNCDIVAGRDEGDFYAALGIVGAGPIDAWGSGDLTLGIGNLLDGQYWHGFPNTNLGLRQGSGHDPVRDFDISPNSQWFSLGEGGNGVQRYNPEKAAGVAFLEIRRTDTKGLQLSTLDQHTMQAVVGRGLKGWVWTGTGSRSEQLLINPIWIAVNALLKARGYNFADTTTAETLFDVPAAVSAAAICDTLVTPLIGDAGTETQFRFQGLIRDQRPLKDWLTDILMNCCGNFVNSFGKIKFMVRVNSSGVSNFNVGNMILNSLQTNKLKPTYNHLTVDFADSEYGFQSNAVRVYDIGHAKFTGNSSAPLFTKSTMHLSGVSTKSQGGRIAVTRLREEIGGVTENEWKYAREGSFATTVLSLAVEAGMVCDMNHPDLPDYPATVPANTVDVKAGVPNFIEFRVQNWKLNPDYSVDIAFKTTHRDMYVMNAGPKPADVESDPIPFENEFAPADWGYKVHAEDDGKLTLDNFFCATNADSVDKGRLAVYYVNESNQSYRTVQGNCSDVDTTFRYFGQQLNVGSYIQVNGEVMLVTSCTPDSPPIAGSITVNRAQLGTTAVVHNQQTGAVTNGGDGQEFSITTGLSFERGTNLVLLRDGDQRTVSSYDPSNGLVDVLRPFTTLPTGGLFVEHRIYEVSLFHDVIAFQPHFFKVGDRSKFSYVADLEWAGVVAVELLLENIGGKQSDVIRYLYDQNVNHRLRTMGSLGYEMLHPEAPAGSLLSAFQSIQVRSQHALRYLYAERGRPGVAYRGPIIAPDTKMSIVRGASVVSGTLTIGGGVVPGSQISIEIGDPTSDFLYLKSNVLVISSESTFDDVAASLTTQLNSDPNFSQYFLFTQVGNIVNVVDKLGILGVITPDFDGGITVVATGMNSPLGVNTGRKYALTFKDEPDGFESDLSFYSATTGPTGGANYLSLKDLPGSCFDPRVDTINIYALPDGADENHVLPHLVSTLSLGVTECFDNTTETDLLTRPLWPGETQPTDIGEVTIVVKRNLGDWVKLNIKDAESISQVVDGVALDGLSEGTVLTASVDISADADGSEVRVVLG